MLFNHKMKAGRGALRRGVMAGNAGLAAIYLLTALLLAACAGLGPEKPEGVLPPEEPPEKASASTEEHPRENTALFKGLPSGTRSYLLKLQRAFAAHDAAFLLAQGEGEYEKAVRNLVNEEQYLAMLYRAGRYADDAAWEAPHKLYLNRVAYIDYTEWREQGPALEIDGKIYMDKDRPVIFSMKVLWRLNEPKILGIYP
jgi:hypothetical protein